MRLYSRSGAASVTIGGKRYEPAADGGFDLPQDAASLLHASAVRGEAQWENAIEKQNRLIAEEAARRADPATLLAAVEKLVAQAEAAQPAAAKTPAAKAPAASRAAAK